MADETGKQKTEKKKHLGKESLDNYQPQDCTHDR